MKKSEKWSYGVMLVLSGGWLLQMGCVDTLLLGLVESVGAELFGSGLAGAP